VQIKTDAKRAVRLAKKVLKGRRSLFAVRELIEQRGPLPAGRYRIGVYFADSDVNIYQMRQWYAPLRLLNETRPVLLISRHPAGALALMEESGLDVALAQKVKDIEQLIEEQPLEVILYVNQNTRNFQMMRYGHRWHVFINHGESDKMYMTTNQFKTYDRALVAGDAARARLSRALWDYDVDERTISIGRPQTDHLSGEPPYTPDERIVVFYAPTWEGDRPAAGYGSVASHGEALVRRLIETGRHRVVYRPHPRSGVVDPEFGEANQRIIAALAEANRRDPSAQHVYDQSPAIGWQLSLPDVAICDVSAMVYDRLATGRPLMVTRPVSPEAELDEGGYLGVCEWLAADDTARIDEVLDRVIGDEAAREHLGTWSKHYFGDTTPGEPTKRFHAAIDALLDRADEWKAKDRAREAAGR
jgi:hypothetical protein